MPENEVAQKQEVCDPARSSSDKLYAAAMLKTLIHFAAYGFALLALCGLGYLDAFAVERVALFAAAEGGTGAGAGTAGRHASCLR